MNLARELQEARELLVIRADHAGRLADEVRQIKAERDGLDRELAACQRDASLAEKHWHRDQSDLAFIVSERDGLLATIGAALDRVLNPRQHDSV